MNPDVAYTNSVSNLFFICRAIRSPSLSSQYLLLVVTVVTATHCKSKLWNAFQRHLWKSKRAWKRQRIRAPCRNLTSRSHPMALRLQNSLRNGYGVKGGDGLGQDSGRGRRFDHTLKEKAKEANLIGRPGHNYAHPFISLWCEGAESGARKGQSEDSWWWNHELLLM